MNLGVPGGCSVKSSSSWGASTYHGPKARCNGEAVLERESKLRVPEEVSDLPVVASVSGGKDSTALMLALRESGIEFRAVFADTGWEAPETYAYLDLLRERIGPIDVVRAASKGDGSEPSAMVDRILFCWTCLRAGASAGACARSRARRAKRSRRPRRSRWDEPRTR